MSDSAPTLEHGAEFTDEFNTLPDMTKSEIEQHLYGRKIVQLNCEIQWQHEDDHAGKFLPDTWLNECAYWDKSVKWPERSEILKELDRKAEYEGRRKK